MGARRPPVISLLSQSIRAESGLLYVWILLPRNTPNNGTRCAGKSFLAVTTVVVPLARHFLPHPFLRFIGDIGKELFK